MRVEESGAWRTIFSGPAVRAHHDEIAVRVGASTMSAGTATRVACSAPSEKSMGQRTLRSLPAAAVRGLLERADRVREAALSLLARPMQPRPA